MLLADDSFSPVLKFTFTFNIIDIALSTLRFLNSVFFSSASRTGFPRYTLPKSGKIVTSQWEDYPISYFPSIPWYFFDCRQLQYLTFSPIHVIMNSICEIHFRKNTEMSGHNRPVSQHFYEGAYGTKTQFSYTGFVSVCT